MENLINRFSKFSIMVCLLGIILTALFNKYHILPLNVVTYFLCLIGFFFCGGMGLEEQREIKKINISNLIQI